MKKAPFFLLFCLFILRGPLTPLTAQNIYQSIGKTTEVLTLSNGQYQEIFPNDTIVHIGSVLFNTVTHKIVAFVESNEEDSTVVLMETSRFLSIDPLGRKYPELSPYQFASNTPIMAIDLDGLEAYLFLNSNQIDAVRKFESGKNLNVTWMTIKMTTFDDISSYLQNQYDICGKKAKAVYVTMHGTPGEVYTDPGKNGIIETVPCPDVAHCPDNDDKSFGGKYVIDKYIEYMQSHTTLDPTSEAAPRIDKLKKVMDQIDDGGTLILGGCNIAWNSAGSKSPEGDETLEALNRLSGGRINIVANHDLTSDVTSSQDAEGKTKAMFLDSGRTSKSQFSIGWKIIGPATGGKIETTGKNLMLNSQNQVKCYEFIIQPLEEKKH